MFRRARLSVKPNVRPGIGARGSTAPNPQRGQESPRPPEPAAEAAPKPAEPTDVPAVDPGGAEPEERTPRRSDEKIGDENNVEESSKSSSTVSLRRKRVSSTSSLVKPRVNVPSQCHPLSAVNQDTPQQNSVPRKEKQLCSDRYRIYKAQKLREMLKEELRKEKKQWKNKYAINESQKPPDRSKMTMRDFIYYLPDNNPMTSSLEQEKRTEKSSTPVQSRDRQESKSTLDAEDNEEMEEETDDGPLLVPRVKVAEDGSIILDEESLTVEVLRTKGPCVVEENDPIFERGSTTTYSSFRKNYYSKPWSNKETDMFFLAISMVGTDFSMIGQLFPHRARTEIKNKFKREEKTNGWRIDKAFQEKRPFDFDFFAHLLQKVLAEEEKRKQKSIKNQSLKEKKSSKPRKNVKVKKVTSEGVNDDPDEAESTKISDTERSQQDAQAVEEESLPSSEQDSEQVPREQDRNQKKKRRKNQDEANEQEVKHLLGNATIQSVLSKGEKHKNKSRSLKPEVNEGECSTGQKLPCAQNIDDIVDLASTETIEMRTDSIFSESDQQDTMPVATESSELSISDMPLSEIGNKALCEVTNADSNCTEERNVNPENKPLETDQAKNVKPMLRGRLQKPKPNLSRAVGKKSVLSEGKTDAQSKSSHSETSVEKNQVEKNKMNTSDSFEVENTERENLEAETVSHLSEKTCLQEDNQPKAFRPTRLMRGRSQRLKPNVGKAAERKETLASQEKIETHIEKKEDESCADRNIPQQMEDQSCENVECKDVISQPENKDASLENVQPDEPKTLNECLSIQEDNQTNVLKQVPVLRTRFQKPKPNIRRGIRKREFSSKEEVPEEIVSGEMTTALREIVRTDTPPREEVPVMTTTTTTEEMKSDLQETGRRNLSPNEKMPEMADVPVEMEADLEATGGEISQREKILDMTDVPVEMETGLEAPGKEIFPMEKMPEMTGVSVETEIGLKATGRAISPRDKMPEVMDSTEEIDTNLEESRTEISPQENGPGEVKPLGEMETRMRTLQMVDATEERETDLEGTERQEISALVTVPEEFKPTGEMETHLKEIRETSQGEKVLTKDSALGGQEIDVKETGKRDISLMETIAGQMTAIEEMETDFKETGREVSLRVRDSERIGVTEEMADLEKTGKIDISPRKNEPEELGTSRQTERNVMQRSSGDHITMPSLDMKIVSSEVLPVIHTPIEEKKSEMEVSSHLSHFKTSSEASELGETEDQQLPPSDVPDQSSNINLSKSLPQEQKPLQVKPAPFVRSRFKRPKPNLARAALKKETTKAEKYGPGKKLETDKTETIAIQQDSEQADTLPSQHDVASLTSRDNDTSSHEEEDAVILPCVQTERDPSPPKSCESKEESPSAQTQENDLALPTGTHKINTFSQEIKESVTQTALPMRGRLQRPRPNVKKARQRPVEKDEAKGVTMEERTIPQREGTERKSLLGSNSQIETEIEVVSSKVSECRMDENQSHVVPVENLHVNERNVLDEKMKYENKPYVPSPTQLIRRKFQKTKPNLAHSKKEDQGMEKSTAYQSKASKKDDLLQQGHSDTQLLQNEKMKILTSLEVSARKDFVGSKESGLAMKDVQLEVIPSGSIGDETVGNNSMSSIAEEQYLSKLASCPQLMKEPNYSKVAVDRRTTIPSASECELDHNDRRVHRKVKLGVTKGRGSKRARGKTSKREPRAARSVLVTLRASQEEDADDGEDFESDYEEESCQLAPEELSKAPVFVPVGLRSPEPVSAQIEETMEELEITENVADIGCVTVVEHQLSNTDVTTQEVKQEKNLNTSSFGVITGEQIQDEPGTSDGSTEAAIALLTMGDLVLQSEISTEQGNGVCAFPDVHSKDEIHLASSDNIDHKIVHEYQQLSSTAISTSPASFEENKIVSEEQSTKEVGLMEEVKENAPSPRNTTSKVTSNLRIRSRFVRPKPNLARILGTNRLGAHQKDPNFCVTTGDEVEIQRETEESSSKAIELEEENLRPVTIAESKEQNKLTCLHTITGTSISQEANLTIRSKDPEERAHGVQTLPPAPVVSSETEPCTRGSGGGLGESSYEETLTKDSKGDSVLTLHVPECTPTSIPEVQQENVINPQDLTVNLLGSVHQDGEDEQAFILTLVEIPTNSAEEFTDAAAQLMPNPLLPAPILVKSGNTEEKGDMSKDLPATSVGQDAMCLSNSERDDSSEKSSANLDLISRKRFHYKLDESIHVPPAKKRSLPSRDDCQEYTSEVCSKELNVFEETGESYTGQDISPTSGSTLTTPEPQKEQLEPTFQNIGPRSLDKIRDTCIEKNTPQDEMVVSDKEKRMGTASNSEQMGSITSSSKPPLSRPGRRPLGFLSLICSKNNLESDESTPVHSKKRLKPLIPASRRNLKRSHALNESQKKNPESSDLLPSASVTNTQSENIGSSTTQASCDQPSLKEERKRGQKRAPEREATTVSEYFFNDIFIEVDETE